MNYSDEEAERNSVERSVVTDNPQAWLSGAVTAKPHVSCASWCSAALERVTSAKLGAEGWGMAGVVRQQFVGLVSAEGRQRYPAH